MDFNTYRPNFDRGFKETFLSIFPDGEVDFSNPASIVFRANGLGAMVLQEKKYDAWLKINKAKTEQGQLGISPHRWGVELAKNVALQFEQSPEQLQKESLAKLSIDTISIGLLPTELLHPKQVTREICSGLHMVLAYEDDYIRQYLQIEDLEMAGIEVNDEQIWEKAKKQTLRLQFAQRFSTQMMGAVNIVQMDNAVTRLLFPNLFGNQIFLTNEGSKKLGPEEVVYLPIDQNTLAICAPEDWPQALVIAPMVGSKDAMWPVLMQLAFKNRQLISSQDEQEVSIEEIHQAAEKVMQGQQIIAEARAKELEKEEKRRARYAARPVDREYENLSIDEKIALVEQEMLKKQSVPRFGSPTKGRHPWWKFW